VLAALEARSFAWADLFDGRAAPRCLSEPSASQSAPRKARFGAPTEANTWAERLEVGTRRVGLIIFGPVPSPVLVESKRAPGQGFEFLAKFELMVLYQLDKAPLDEEWDAYLGALAEAMKTQHFRAIVITEGGYPSRAQRSRMMVLVKDKPTRVAVISGAATVRFVVSAIALINPHIRAYSTKEYELAFVHLGLARAEGVVVKVAIEQLARKLDLAKRAAA
jgi:hypothetical protein